MEMLRLLGTVPVDRYTVETKALLRETLRRWMDGNAGAERAHIVEVDLDELRDDPRFGRLTQLPTAFDAAPRDVDELRCAARRLLATNPEYRRLMREVGAGDGVAPSAGCAPG
jgi:regulator of sirC expression with transglutaminase-like and TPR domain